METRSAKRKRLNVAMRDNIHRYKGEDRISELSDDVIHHILSRLPTKTIATMSVLSKRWNLIWSSYPDLDFSSMPHVVENNKAMDHDNRVMNVLDFISNVLVSNHKHSIRVLRFSAKLSLTRLNRLIKQAVKCDVQELDLIVNTEDCYNLTRSVVTCKSLRVLKLKSNAGLRLPPLATTKDGFQSLHTLSLVNVNFVRHHSLIDLFSETSFPLLKKLDLERCVGLKRLCIDSREIVDITLNTICELTDLSIFCRKLETLKVRSCFKIDAKGLFEIAAPLLKIFVWKDNAFVESSFVEKSIYLEKASIADHTYDSKVCIRNLLCGISHSRKITFDRHFFWMLTTKDDTRTILPHSFDNLEILELNISFKEKQISTLVSLIRISPSLHTLIINVKSVFKVDFEEWDKEWCDLFFLKEEVYWERKVHGFNTFGHNVKVVKINGYDEYTFVFCLTKFLNKYGIGMQEMIFALGTNKAKARLMSQFNGFRWASSIAKISFVNA